MSDEGNKTAYLNGRFCEKCARELFPDLEWVNEKLDGVYKGVPVEVKSCQIRTKNGFRGESAGRFIFTPCQQKELMENNGLYILLVHDGETIRFSRMVKASLIFSEFTTVKKATWWKLFNIISVNQIPSIHAVEVC